MPVPSLTELKKSFSVADIGDERLQFCLDGAIRRAKKRLGLDLFDLIFNSTPVTPEEELRFESITSAILHLAMAAVLINANMRIRRSGQVKREQDVGSPGMSGNQITNEYLSPTEINQWRSTLIAEAEVLISEYEPEPSGASSETFAIERG